MNSTEDIGSRFVRALGWVLAAGIFVHIATQVVRTLREWDLLWHIKSGQWILANGTVPRVDPFSHTQAGQPWIAKEWLSQIIYALSFDALGWAGPLLVVAATIALTAYLIFSFAARSLQPFVAAALVLLTVFLIGGVTVARPHVLTFPVALAFTVMMFDAARSSRVPPYWSLALVVLWTNLHGSFPLAWIIAGCAFLDFVQRSWFSDRKALVHWTSFLVLSVAVTLLNPYFTTTHVVAMNMANGAGAAAQISEWNPFNAQVDRYLEIGLLGMLVVLFWTRPKLTIGQILFVLITLHMTFTHTRFVYVFFLLVPAAIMAEMTAAAHLLSKASWLQRPRDGIEQLLGRNSQAVAALATVLVVAFGAFVSLVQKPAPPQEVAIPGALKFLAENTSAHTALQKSVLNDFNFGGPLILAGIKTYIDDRTEQLYPPPFLRTYLQSSDGDATALDRILRDASIGWTIFPAGDVRNDHMSQMPEWQKTFGDDYAVIYERKS